MVSVTLQELLESGLYFGHPGKQLDPRMKPYIFGKRQGIYIIDLEKTKSCLEKACEFLKEAAREGKSIIVVGTKRQARDMVKNAAEELGLLYMANHWLGGTLTNFQTLKLRINRLNELEAKEAVGTFEKLTKKDAAVVRKEKERLLKNLEGVRKMERIPDIMLIIDARKEENAIREAKKLGLKVAGVVDTNSNPELLDYPVPANDDGIKGLRLLLQEFSAAIRTGQEERAGERKEGVREEKTEAKKEAEAKEEKPAVVEEAVKAALEKAAAAEEKVPVVKEAPKEEVAVPAAKEEEAEQKKVPAKPKPRPRIRAKVRRTVVKKTTKEKSGRKAREE